MKLDEFGVGKITAQNTTKDVKPGETERQAKKFFGGNGKPKLLHKTAAKNSDPNTLMNLGISESVDSLPLAERSMLDQVLQALAPKMKPQQYEKAAQALHDVLIRKSREGQLRHSLGYYAQRVGRAYAGIDYRALADYYTDTYGTEGITEAEEVGKWEVIRGVRYYIVKNKSGKAKAFSGPTPAAKKYAQTGGKYPWESVNEAEEVIPMLYHATYRPFLDSIMKNGLGGKGAQTQWEDSKPGYIYLAKDPEVAVSHAEANEEVSDEYIDNIVVLSIDASQLDQDNLEDDPNVMDDDSTLAYKGIIPTSAFSVMESLQELRIEKPAPKDTMGIERKYMPQIKTADYPEFIEYLENNGARFRSETIPAADLKAMQKEFSDAGILKQMEKNLRDGPNTKAVIASSDDYILDGHHRWLVALNTGADLNVYRVNMPAWKLYDLVNDFEKTYYKDIYDEGAPSIGVPLASGLVASIFPHRPLKIKKSTPGKLNYNESAVQDEPRPEEKRSQELRYNRWKLEQLKQDMQKLKQKYNKMDLDPPGGIWMDREEYEKRKQRYRKSVDDPNAPFALTMREDLTQADIDQLEVFADKLFAKVGIDVEFTRHFLDRVNDERNKKPITMAELTRLFKQEFKRWGKPIAQMGPDAEAVMKDLQTDVNLPFVLQYDRANNELDLVAKTVMRKKDFKTPDREFAVEDSQPNTIGGMINFPGYEEKPKEKNKKPKYKKIPDNEKGLLDKIKGWFTTEELDEDLRDWFKQKWVNIGKKNKDGSHPECGTSGKKKGYAKCVPAAKAKRMSKKEKASATRRKRAAQNKAGRGGKNKPGSGKKPIRVSTKARKKKSESINESFDNPYQFKVTKRTKERWEAQALTDASPKMIIAMSSQRNDMDGGWGVDFTTARAAAPQATSYAITGAGDAQRTFATVLAMLKQLIADVDPPIIYFDADKKSGNSPGTSRTDLYQALVKRFASSMGYDFDVEATSFRDNFVLTKKNTNEAWSAKYKRSINCDNPKGFSQKAHCAGRKKTESIVDEGVNDPHIFKAVFLAGGPGSGKSFVANNILGGTGLRTVNSDEVYEFLMQKQGLDLDPATIASPQGQDIRSRAKELTDVRMHTYLKGRIGLIIDGTGKDVAKYQTQVEKLGALGYDSMMIFVNTSEDVAQQRNAQRSRSLPPSMVTKMWSKVQDNLMKFQQVFGASRFHIIDNSGGLEDLDRKDNFDKVYNETQRFLNTPPNRRAAQRWIQQQQKAQTDGTQRQQQQTTSSDGGTENNN